MEQMQQSLSLKKLYSKPQFLVNPKDRDIIKTHEMTKQKNLNFSKYIDF